MKEKKRAFTLVELLIAMVVGLVLLAAAYGIFNQQNKTLQTQEKLASVYQNARIGMEMMVRDISMAGHNQLTDSAIAAGGTAVPRCTSALVAAGTACVGITVAGANSISFSSDLNGNGSITPGSGEPNENITYSLYTSSGVPSLGRTSNGSLSPAVEYVQSLGFVYQDSSGNSTANIANIARVKITLTTRAPLPDNDYTDPTYGDHYRRYTLTSYAIPRNLQIATTSTTTSTTTATTSTTATTTTATTATTTATTTASTTATTTATTTASTTATTTATTTASTTVPSGGSSFQSITQTPSGGAIAKNVNVGVCAIVTDSGAATVRLITNQSDDVIMTLSGGTYCGTIPKHNNKTVIYYLQTYDAGGAVRDTSASFTYNQAG